jgi:hypothetical protein
MQWLNLQEENIETATFSLDKIIEDHITSTTQARGRCGQENVSRFFRNLQVVER